MSYTLIYGVMAKHSAQHLSMNSMLYEGELLISMTFNRSYASAAILNGLFADTIRSYVHEGGHYVVRIFAIPFNSNVKAEVVINFLLSPEAQAKDGFNNMGRSYHS